MAVPERSMNKTLYLFGGSNGAGKTTFAKAYLTLISPLPRFLNADEIARGLSPLDPTRMSVSAGKLLLHEVDGCLSKGDSFGLESTLSGTSHMKLLNKAKAIGYRIELHYLWLPSPELAIRRIAQRVKKGGHFIPENDVRRRFNRSLSNFINLYAELADSWIFRDNTKQSASLLFDSGSASLPEVESFLKKK
jgi:predicted ABC-type ATPase